MMLKHAFAAPLAVALCVLLLVLGLSSGSSATHAKPSATRPTVTRTVTATATVTRTVTATATVTAPGPTTTVTVPGPTVTVTGTPTASSTPTPTPTQPAGGNCTDPVWSSSEATGTYKIDDTWWIDNDAWSGSHGPQTLYVCNGQSWYAVSNQPNVQGQVMTYPNTEYDVNGRGQAFKTIADYSSITSTFAEEFPTTGSMDAAYDLWLNDWDTEIMIWNEWTGTQTYWPSDKSTTVSLGGVSYWFQDLGGEFIFFRQSQVKSGSVDLLAAMRYLVSRGLVKATDVPTQLEYGAEICSTVGTQTFPLTGLTFSLS